MATTLGPFKCKPAPPGCIVSTYTAITKDTGIDYNIGSDTALVTLRDFVLSSDGTKIYLTSATSTGADIHEYTMSTAWDLSTMSSNHVLDVTSNFSPSTGQRPDSLAFSTDGTKLYATASTGAYINHYNLSTAWLLSSATHSYKENYSNFSGSTTSAVRRLVFNSAGTRALFIDTSNNKISDMSMTTAHDLRTCTVSNSNYPTNFNREFASSFSCSGIGLISPGDTSTTNYELTTAYTDNPLTEKSQVSFTFTTDFSSRPQSAEVANNIYLVVYGFSPHYLRRYTLS